MQAGPTIRTKPGLAASTIARRRVEPLLCDSAPIPAVTTQTPRVPSAESSLTRPGIEGGGVAITARSGGAGSDSMLGYVPVPRTRSRFGLTRYTSPSKSRVRFSARTRPTEPDRSLAPISATDSGWKTASRLRTVKKSSPCGSVGPHTLLGFPRRDTVVSERWTVDRAFALHRDADARR